MTPAARGGKPRRRGRNGKRRGGAMARIAFGFLVVLAAGMAAVALYFGFLPNPLASRGSASDAPGADSIPVADVSSRLADTAVGAPPGTTAAPAIPAPDTAATFTQTDIAAGDVLYRGAGRCVGCHGALGEGAGTLGPSLRDSTWSNGDGSIAAIERVIANGAPPSGAYRIAMPAYASQLGMPDIGRLAAYVYALSHPGAGAPDTLPTPTEAGNVDARPTVPAAAAGGTTTDAPARVARPTVPPPPPPRPRP